MAAPVPLPVPAVPERSRARHPDPRAVWTSACGRFRAFVLDWADDPCCKTVQVHARRGATWQHLAGDELWPCIVALVLEKDKGADDGRV
jgi:hypothetical protein